MSLFPTSASAIATSDDREATCNMQHKHAIRDAKVGLYGSDTPIPILGDSFSDTTPVPTIFFAAMLPVDELVQVRLRKKAKLEDFIESLADFFPEKFMWSGVREGTTEFDYDTVIRDDILEAVELTPESRLFDEVRDIHTELAMIEARCIVVTAEAKRIVAMAEAKCIEVDKIQAPWEEGGAEDVHPPGGHPSFQRPNHRDKVGRTPKPRTILPIIIDKHKFDSRPDTGSEENIMTFELTTRLGLNIENSQEHQREFRIADGKVVKALGRVQALCAFAKERGVSVIASFYVFRTLVSEVIMGMNFLDSTETLTKYKYRLDKQLVLRHGLCQISVLNNPKRRLRCTATGKAMLANADTGAEMDLISLKYARMRGFKCHILVAGETQVQLADGSTTHLAGKVFLDIKLRTNKGITNAFYSESVKRPFYILRGLTCPLLLGEETLEFMDVFEKYHESLALETLAESISDKPEVCTILWSDTATKFFNFNTNAPPPLSDEIPDTSADRPLSQTARQRVKSIFSSKKRPLASLGGDLELAPSFEDRLRERDARESYRREVENATIKKMPSGPGKERKIREEQSKCNEYEADKQRLLQARSRSSSGDPLSGSGDNRGQYTAEVHELPTGQDEEADEDLYNA